jgi:hypothetical protein
MKLIYLNIALSSVFDSQVVELLKAYESSGEFEDIILLYGWKNKAEIEIVKEKFTDSSISIIFFKAYPNYLILDWLTVFSILKVIKPIKKMNEYIFHVRGEVPGYYLLKALKLISCNKTKVLVDIRGASIEEVQIYSPLPAILKKLKVSLNKKALNCIKENNIKLSAVSLALKEYLITKGSKDDEIMINHCLAGKDFYFDPEKRVRVRKELNLSNDDICIVFSSGGSANWQNSEIVMDILRHNDKVKVLNLAKKEIIHNRVINRFVPYREMPSYLCAADFGLIIRNDNIVNNVACPVKLVEYYSCGLPVIHNNTIAMIRNYDFLSAKSISLDEIAGLDLLAFDLDRCQLSKAAISIFGIDQSSSIYRQICNVL